MEKRSSVICKLLPVLIFSGLSLSLLGCTGMVAERPLIIRRSESIQEPVQAERSNQIPERNDSKILASLQLTNQGQTFLENGNPDDAISMLEKSIGLDPKNGQSYYWLAEAWFLKGNRAQAEEFNRLADLYLKDDPNWTMRVLDQKARILKVKS
jgi:tetratricopeptide (TPR) repeat protein